MSVVLSVSGVSLAFGGVQVLDGVTFDVQRGSITGVIGPNGAGKTTLFDCISGFLEPAGSIVLHAGDGPVELVGRPPEARVGLGLGRTFQNARLFKSMPIREVLTTVQHHHMGGSGFFRSVLGTASARADERRVAQRADDALELVGMTAHADKTPAELSTGMLRLCELAAAAAVAPEVLILDEPASGIAQAETEALEPVLRNLAAHLGATLVIIEHDMPLVMSLCEEIVALAAGKVVTVGPPDHVRNHPEVLRSYLGATA